MPLRVAVPNKGSLSADAVQLLGEAGYRVHRGQRELRRHDPGNGVLFFFQRPRDIATYVALGALDVGITGQDILADSGAAAGEVLRLGFARSTFFFAARPDRVTRVEEITGRRVATSYPNLVAKYLADRGISADVVKLDGAVENAIELGLADVIADVVETGWSLRNSGLVTFGEPLLSSEAVLVRAADGKLPPEREEAVALMVSRLRGVLTARRYVMVEYDCPRAVLDVAASLTPGIEGPTVAPLATEDWFAVRSLVERTAVHEVMDGLRRVGAKAIVVTALQDCRI